MFSGKNLYRISFNYFTDMLYSGYGKRWHYNAEQVIELRAFPNIKMTLGEIFESVF